MLTKGLQCIFNFQLIFATLTSIIRPRTSEFDILLINKLRDIFALDMELYDFAKSKHYYQSSRFSEFDDRLREWHVRCNLMLVPTTTKYGSTSERIGISRGSMNIDSTYRCQGAAKLVSMVLHEADKNKIHYPPAPT